MASRQSNSVKDGGGIRGYSSLLIVQELMKIISIIELEKDPEATSSYHPLPFLKNKGSQVPDDGAALPGVRYLPVHYFDYMGKLYPSRARIAN
jgi:hypothetical protein